MNIYIVRKVLFIPESVCLLTPLTSSGKHLLIGIPRMQISLGLDSGGLRQQESRALVSSALERCQISQVIAGG